MNLNDLKNIFDKNFSNKLNRNKSV